MSASEDEVMDDGLHIKPPQPHHRHKDRKRDRGHRHSQKSSRNNKDVPLMQGMVGVVSGGSGERRQHERRHHHRDEDQRPRHRDVERIERKERERGPSSSSSLKQGHHRSSSSRKRGDEEKSAGSSRDVVLFEVKKERRNIELENERALREIERRREKEKGQPDPFGGDGEISGRHRREKRSHRDRDREQRGGDRERTRRQAFPTTPPEEQVEEEVVEDVDPRIQLEVQDIEESSGSDLEEGERSRSAHSREDQEPEEEDGHGDASDKSDVSSASDHETEEKVEHEEEEVNKATSDVSSSGSSRKSHSEKSDASSSSSSSSESDSDDEGGNETKDNGEEDGPSKPSKVPRKDSPTPFGGQGSNDPTSSKQPTSDDSREVPSVVITVDENEEEDDLLPPYYPAIQGCRRVEEFQLLNRIEEGTYGVVYRAKEKRTDEVVALKRLKMEKEKDGFPITSLREINTLLKAQHENIVTVREIVVGSNTDKIFLVMDYVEHDLKALMETLKLKGQVFLPEEVKCLMIQLLRAVAHLHDNWILHRDLKTSNLLLSHKGILKVGDFGLAREYGSPLKAYTPIVVTLWYRAPELLLGTKEYSTPIDVWSVGCIFGELLKMEPMFPGKMESNQLNLIFQSLGTPNDRIWPGYSQFPLVQKMTFADYPVNKLKTRFGHLTDQGIDLMNKFLTFNPAKRITAEDALDHAFFKEMPVAIDPSMFPTWPAKSELGHRKAVASPKPPSGGHQFKGMKDEEDTAGFFLGGGDARRQPTGAGFSLKF